MRTLHLGLRVTDLDRSLAYYRSVGYEVVGEVRDTDIGHLTMLQLPGDDFVTLELVHHPDYTPTGGDSPLLAFAAVLLRHGPSHGPCRLRCTQR